MVDAHPDPFQGGVVSIGLTSIQPTITCIPSSGTIGPSPYGPVITAHTVVGSLPTSGGSIPSIVVTSIPPYRPGGSGPSMSVTTILAIPVTLLMVGSQPHPP